jgi:DnaK suppressor protein
VTKASPVKNTAPTPPAKKSPPAKRTVASRLVVLEAEKPWTQDELNEVRNQLRADVKRLRNELDEVAGDLADLMRDAGESAGSDQADVGSATFERDQEMTIVNNARDMLMQSEHALERIADGTFGVCEMCGNPIGKNRLMVFPRATMCMTCKQREERR